MVRLLILLWSIVSYSDLSVALEERFWLSPSVDDDKSVNSQSLLQIAIYQSKNLERRTLSEDLFNMAKNHILGTEDTLTQWSSKTNCTMLIYTYFYILSFMHIIKNKQ